LGVFVFLLATLLSISFWRSLNTTRPVLVVSRDLPVGAVIGPSDLTVEHVIVPNSMYAVALTTSSKATLVGRRVTEPVHAGQMLTGVEVSGDAGLGPTELALTIPVSPEMAAGGGLRPGDQVQILRTLNPGEPGSTTEVVLPRVTVYDVGLATDMTSLDTGDEPPRSNARGAVGTLTLRLEPQQAVTLANAKHNAALDVALLAPQPDQRSR
jgi:Flp pilus assembly protein CpaB